MMKLEMCRIGENDFEVPEFYHYMMNSMINYEYKFNNCRFSGLKNNLVLDIGGNVGLFGVIAMKMFDECTVLSYEPEPENCEVFRRNMDRFPNVHLIQKAVWNRDCVKVLSRDTVNPGAHSLVMPMMNRGEEIKVECVDAAKLPVCRLIKLDCEGSEYQILKRYFDKVCRPCMVTYEYHSDNDMRKLDRLIRKQVGCEYRQCGGVRLSFNSGTASWLDLNQIVLTREGL